MANRVVLDVSGLRVSKAGFNVLTTGMQNMLFVSDSAGLKFHSSGVINVPATIENDSQSTYTYNYGTNFGYIPVVFIQLRWYLQTVFHVTPWISRYVEWYGNDTQAGVFIECTSSALTVKNTDGAAGAGFNFDYTLYYQIWEHDFT